MLYKIEKGGGIRMREVNRNKALMAIFLNMLIFTFIAGCATDIQSERETPTEKPQIIQESRETAISLYYDFKDVPVPKEMDIKKEKSFVFQTTEFTTGVLTFSGNVESDSLIKFFNIKMPEDGWRLLSSFKSPKNILFFQKENRFCIITIISKTFTTDLEIIVTPSFQSS